MKVLIIDNGSTFLDSLKGSLIDCEILVSDYDKAEISQSQQADLIVLSGGHKYAVVNHQNKYAKELAIIKSSLKPIIGICLGFELIVAAYGGELESMKKRARGILEIEVNKTNAFFGNRTKLKVYESHRWTVKKLPDSFMILASSRDGVEAIKHKTLPIYGLQFHPEISPSFSATQLTDLLNF